jgi:hypothetical protein
MKSAFIPFDERLAIIDDVIKPRYAVLIGWLAQMSQLIGPPGVA